MSPVRSLVALVLVAALPWPVTAAPLERPGPAVPAATEAVNDQLIPSAVADGLGGVLLAWVDKRSDNGDIYMKALDGNGVARWGSLGVCVGTGAQYYPSVVSDGAHGAIVTWYDDRDYATTGADVYCQHLRANGTVDPAWTANGVAVCDAAGNQTLHASAPDGAGGVIVVWRDGRDLGTTGYDIYVQRIRANGTPAWTTNGVPVCTASAEQSSPAIEPDGAGGAFLAWDDARGGPQDIYVQHVDSTGAMTWTPDGRLVCGAPDVQAIPALAADGVGGVFVTWNDNRGNGVTGYDIYATHVLGDGTPDPAWTADGDSICAAPGSQFYPEIVSDGAGGAILTWYDGRGADDDIYAQRVATDGTVAWTVGGVPLCTASGEQTDPVLVGDGSHGAIVTWRDDRVTGRDVYAQRVDATGAPKWAANGVPVCAASGTQDDPVIVGDGAGGAIVAWQDARSTPTLVYAARLSSGGTRPWIVDGVVAIELSLASVETAPHEVRLAWYATTRDFVATVYRSTDGMSWSAIATAFPDGAGWLRVDDASVAPGTRYGYRLGIVSGGAGSFLGEAWVTTPGDARFALEGPRPNPALGPLVIACSLAGGVPATLELLDVGGRRIATRELAAGAAGERVVDLGRDVRPAPGLYMIRLTQGGRTLTRKAVISR